MRAIAGKLVADARGGRVQAAREVFEWPLGKPQEADLLARIKPPESLLRKGDHEPPHAS